MSISRRQWLGGAAASLAGLPLAGCFDQGQSDFATLGRAVGGLFSQGGDLPASVLERARSLPFATLSGRFSGAQPALLVLESLNGRTARWVAQGQTAVLIRNGRLIRTAGLPHNLDGTRFTTPDPLEGSFDLMTLGTGSVRLIDFADARLYDLAVNAEIVDVAPDSVETSGQVLEAVRVTERHRVPVLDWDYECVFVRDRQFGFVWRASQPFHPDMPAFEYSVIKPPGPLIPA